MSRRWGFCCGAEYCCRGCFHEPSGLDRDCWVIEARSWWSEQMISLLAAAMIVLLEVAAGPERRHSSGARLPPKRVGAENRVIAADYSADEIATVKTWLVTTGQRLEHIAHRAATTRYARATRRAGIPRCL
jgi:hypothetical protein